MDKKIYNNIKDSLSGYRYNSLHYTVYEDVAGCDVIRMDQNLILLAGPKPGLGCYEFLWAANDARRLLDGISNSGKKGLVSFVPAEWVDDFMKRGFLLYGKFNDYFNNDITGVQEPAQPMVFLDKEGCSEAADVTVSCRNQSRGFQGETQEWMRNWITGADAYANDTGVTDCAALVHRADGAIVGVACVGIYAHTSEKGAVLWLREIAVRPEFQCRGIATGLINQALYYGRERGAKRAFLMADELNENAIRLYERAKFCANQDDAQIDMILQ